MANEMKTLSIGGATLWPIDTEARNQIDSKVDDTELQAAVSGALAQAQPNWDAKEGEPGHVLNRTHWVESERVEILPECKLAYEENDQKFFITDVLTVEAGKTYTVNWNGAIYECVAQEHYSDGYAVVCLGDIYTLTDGNLGTTATGEPFVVQIPPADLAASLGVGVLFVPLDGTTELTISIYERCEIIHKLDNKFLDLAWIPVTEDSWVVICPEMTVSEMRKSCGYSMFEGIDTVKVVVEGKAYVCNVVRESTDTGNILYFGNGHIANDSWLNTGEPFCLFAHEKPYDLDNPCFVYSNVEEYYNCSVAIYAKHIKHRKMPNEFLDLEWLPTYELGDELLPTTVVTNGDVSYSDHTSRLDGLGYETHDLYHGKKFVVRMDGKEYVTSVVISGSGADQLIFAGNLSLANSMLPNTGEPFTISFLYDRALFYWYDNGETHTVSIYEYKENKLPEGFLPDSVVTRTELETALGSYITDVAALVGGDA